MVQVVQCRQRIGEGIAPKPSPNSKCVNLSLKTEFNTGSSEYRHRCTCLFNVWANQLWLAATELWPKNTTQTMPIVYVSLPAENLVYYWDFAVAANEFLWMFVIANTGSLEMVEICCCSKFAGINAYGIMTVPYLRDKIWCFWDGFCFAVLCEKSVMSIGTVEKRIHHLLWDCDASSVNTLINI